jgi:iron complex transport system ATP-binding protein
LAVELDLKGVSVHAAGKALLEDVNLRLAEGEFVALLGPNGAGKTTLLRTALGLLPADGQVLLGGKPVRTYSGRQRAALAAWLPQQALVTEPVTALDFVCGARYRFAETRATAQAAATDALEQAGAGVFADRVVSTLSGGEQQRVAIAAMLAQEAPLLLLDEPGNHLDPGQQIALYSLIGRLWQRGHGVLCITHDINLLTRLGNAERVRVVGISEGRIRFDIPLSSADLPAQLGSLFSVEFAVVEASGHRAFLPVGAT